jgi:hypothetical protein
MGLRWEQGGKVERKSQLYSRNIFSPELASLGSRRYFLERMLRQHEGQVHTHLQHSIDSG